MTLLGMARGTIHRLRPTSGTDSYGDPVEDWSAPQRTPLRGASYQDVTSEEADGTVRRSVANERLLFVFGRPSLRPDDRIEIDGDIWRIDGNPVRRQGLASAEFVTATLRRFES